MASRLRGCILWVFEANSAAFASTSGLEASVEKGEPGISGRGGRPFCAFIGRRRAGRLSRELRPPLLAAAHLSPSAPDCRARATSVTSMSIWMDAAAAGEVERVQVSGAYRQ